MVNKVENNKMNNAEYLEAKEENERLTKEREILFNKHAKDRMIDYGDKSRGRTVMDFEEFDNAMEELRSNPQEREVRQGEADVLLTENYNELLLSVVNKYDGETRHETALRYIREAESSNGVGCAKNVHNK